MRDVGSYVSMGAEELPSDQPVEARRLDPLLQLQELDLSVDRLSGRLAHLESEEEVTGARARLAQAEAWLGELRLSIGEVDREQRRLEGDVDSMQRKIDAESKRLYDGSVANAKELQSIGAEVRSLKARKSRMEDQLIELMEQREGLEGRLPPIEGDVAESRTRLAEIEVTSGRELVEIEHALADHAVERKEIVPGIDAELVALYEDVRRQKKGIGAAALADGVCQACHQKLSPVYLSRLKKSEGVRRCEYCRRILVLT